MSSNSGVLYVVATPIGNLGDISSRAIEVLSSVDVIAAEDTRTAKKLLSLLNIKQSCIAYHEHNEDRQINTIKSYLDRGESVALVSDAGTPLISDPGYPLVHSLRQQDYTVIPIPGVSAIITALSVSGIATDRFTFEGFLSAKSTARKKQIAIIKNEPRTLVFYESCHRIQASLDDFCEVLGRDRKATVCRELTKKFETIKHGSLADLCDWVRLSKQQKGEFVIVISGNTEQHDPDIEQAKGTIRVLLEYLGPSQAAAATAQLSGLKKKVLYEIALEIQNNDQS